MFDNAGAKIRKYAEWLFWITLVFVFIIAIVFSKQVEYDRWGDKETSINFFTFFAILLGGAVFAYIESLFLTAFAELVMNTRATVENTAKLLERYELKPSFDGQEDESEYISRTITAANELYNNEKR